MSVELEQYEYYRDDRPGGGGGRGPGTVILKVIGVIAVVVIGFGGAYLGVERLAGWVNEALSTDGDSGVASGIAVQVEVVAGASASEIARVLGEENVISSAGEFEQAVRAQRATDRLQAGVYELETGMNVNAVIAVLIEGPARGEVFRITVIEGLSISQMLESLGRQTDFTGDDLAAALLDGSVTSDLLPGEPTTIQDWEGILFPDTYEISDEFTAVDVLSLMARTAEQRVESVDWTALEARGLTPYQGIVIASMIEREVVVDEERALVASVILNRLEIGMRLQIDATVLYALGNPGRAPTFEDLEFDSPYNTYQIDGLPPTPIAGPRLASLVAAASPSDSEYLFYVLADEDGHHAFTDDFDDFLRLQQESREAGVLP